MDADAGSQTAQEGPRPHLFTHHHLVVEQEENPGLTPPVGLVDPGQLPSVDKLRTPVQEILPLHAQEIGRASCRERV